MTSTDEIAGFAADVEYDRLPDDIREAAKRRLLDAVGVALRNHDRRRVAAIREGLLPAGPPDADGCRLWGTADVVRAPLAATGNAVAVAAGNGPAFLAPTLAPVGGSIAAVVAAAEAAGATGETTLAGIAAALEVHGECAWNAPLDGLHPATYTAVAAAAGAGRAMDFGAPTIADAVGIAAERVALAVGDPDDPLPTGNAARSALYACLLADGGVSAPDAISAPGGWHDRVGPFELDFDPGCERVRDAAVLPYDAHPYEQAAIEAAIELATEEPIDPADISSVTVKTFDAAEPEIDPERIAAALVDRELAAHRGTRTDLEPVVESVTVTADEALTDRRNLGAIPARVTVEFRDGSVAEIDRDGFEGHPSTTETWGTVEEKFHATVEGIYDRDEREAAVGTVRSFEADGAAELDRLLQ
ncbi:MAG: 2-methylcitrate dehydratase [Natronomonas sp.]|jgi:2-methylcitrate dehydratase